MAGWLTLCSVFGCIRFWPVLPWVDDWWAIGNEEFNTVFTGGWVVALIIGTLSDHRFACLNRLKTLVGGVLLRTEGAYIGLGFALEFLVSETLAFGTPFGGRGHVRGPEMFVASHYGINLFSAVQYDGP